MTYKRAGVVWFLIMCYIKLSSPAYTKNSTESIDDLVTTLFKEDGSLLLNLKWRARLNPGTNLDVIINPRGEGCSNKPCSEYGLPGNTTEITFPKDVGQFIEYGQCTFEPGCSYFVKVTTEKRHIQRNLTMTLPGDCYLGICSCRHFKDLPIPDVSAGILDSNSLNISWTIPPLKSKLLERNVTLNSVFISISQGNTQLLTWGGKQSSIYSHFYPLNLTTYNHSTTSKHHFNLSTKLVPGSYYIIRAHIVDVRGCRSRESIFTLPVRVTKNESRQSTESTSSKNSPFHDWKVTELLEIVLRQVDMSAVSTFAVAMQIIQDFCLHILLNGNRITKAFSVQLGNRTLNVETQHHLEYVAHKPALDVGLLCSLMPPENNSAHTDITQDDSRKMDVTHLPMSPMIR
ncbi:unnamed protein product [Hermetia illucens]|uniref:Fibronectin type-III domain-containing protein n=1 Tax=Hermetia illucens TaxID=343691 RepID=A0A7R8UZ79_HERIL|nr:unnamed protein product [Hermetia illucens]